MSEWVTVRIYGGSKDALDAELQLHKARIPARILEDTGNIESIPFLWNGATVAGGAQLQVKRDDLHDAAELLGISLKERDEIEHEDRDEVLRKDAKRTYVTAVVGIFLCPGILHLYSLYLAVTFPVSRQSLDPESRSYLRRAIVLDLVMLIVCGVLFGLLTS